MTRIPLLLVAAYAASAVAACHGPQPVTTPQPEANADSIARERARQDSIAEAERLARVAAERDAARRRADSVAALQRTAEEVQRELAATIHFDFDKATIRPSDAELLDRSCRCFRSIPLSGSGSRETAMSAARTNTTSPLATGARLPPSSTW
jgi:outer membrane protein OmpA-like peptidoglycan-associated protein